MERITANVVNSLGVRRTTFNGRSYLVAPLSLIVPGVLPGSQGPLLYEPDDVKASTDSWNGVSIVQYHPTINGKPTSARDPDILDKSELGRVFRSSFSGKLGGEGWFDEETTKRVDPRIHNSLIKGEKIELSTGVYTKNHPVENGAVHNGKPYIAKAKELRPDHLAILPDEVGACSLTDGCGVFNSLVTNGFRGVFNQLPSPPQPEEISSLPSPKPLAFEVDSVPRSLANPLVAVMNDRRGSLGSSPGDFEVVDSGSTRERLAILNAKRSGGAEKSWQDIIEMIREFVRSKYPSKWAMNGDMLSPSGYCCAVYSDYFIFEAPDATLYRQNWDLDKTGALVVEGDPVKVEKVVTYEPTTMSANYREPTQNTTVTNQGPLAPTSSGGSTVPLTQNQRNDYISYITTNCDCWKFPGAAGTLGSMPDDNLVKLQGVVASEVARKGTPNPTANTGQPSPAPSPQIVPPGTMVQLVYNATKQGYDLVPVPSSPAPVPQAVPVARPVTDEEYLAQTPPGIRAGLVASLNLATNQKNAIIASLLVNVAPERREAKSAELQQLTLPVLQSMSELIPQQPQSGLLGGGLLQPGTPYPVPNYLGASGAPLQNRQPWSKDDDNDILELTVNNADPEDRLGYHGDEEDVTPPQPTKKQKVS